MTPDLRARAREQVEQLIAWGWLGKSIKEQWPLGGDPVTERLARWAEAEVARAVEEHRRLLATAVHCLRSYQYGNSSPDAAEEIADFIELHALRPGAAG